jgi:hypothetical protein
VPATVPYIYILLKGFYIYAKKQALKLFQNFPKFCKKFFFLCLYNGAKKGHTLAGYPLKPCATGLGAQRFASFLMVFCMTIFSTIPKNK